MYKFLQATGIVLILYGSLVSFNCISAITSMSFKMFVESYIPYILILIGGFVCLACNSLHTRLTELQKRINTLESGFRRDNGRINTTA